MKRGAGLFLLLAFLASCRTPASRDGGATADVRVIAETLQPGGMMWTLPQSGVRIAVTDRPLLTAADIAEVDVVALELGRALLLQLTTQGAAVLDQRLAELAGRRLVLVVNGAALGVVRLDASARSGRIVLFVELGDAELTRLVEDLNAQLHPPHRHRGLH